MIKSYIGLAKALKDQGLSFFKKNKVFFFLISNIPLQLRNVSVRISEYVCPQNEYVTPNYKTYNKMKAGENSKIK